MEASSDVFQQLYEDLEELLQTYEAAEPTRPQPHQGALPKPWVPGSAEEVSEGQDNILDVLLEALQSPMHLASQGCKHKAAKPEPGRWPRGSPGQLTSDFPGSSRP